MKSQTSRRARVAWVGMAMAVLVLMGTVAGCSTSQQASVQRPGTSGFLGDTSMLTPGDKEQASLRYVNPAEHVGFVSGRLSPLASKEFTKRDWKMVESYTIAAER